MANETTAPAAALRNPLAGLKRPQVRQLGRTIRQHVDFTDALTRAGKVLEESRFTIKAAYSATETAKATKAANGAEKAAEKATAGLAKLTDSLKDNKPLKAAFAAFQALEKSAASNPAARKLLDEVNADLTIAMATRTSSKDKASPAPAAAKAIVAEALLNGIGVGKVAKKIEERLGELTERARGEVEDVQAGQRKRREPNEFQEPALYPPSLLAKYSLRGKELVDKRHGEVAFIDNGRELRAAKDDVGKDVIDAMLDTAASRGWAPLKVFGTQAFKAALWMEATSRGMDVTGYKPSPEEEAVAAQNRALNGRGNGLAGELAKQVESPQLTRAQKIAEAFQQATTSKAQAKAATEYPELTKAFALVAAFDKAMTRPGMSKAEARDFTDQFKDLVASRLEKGKSLPDVELRDHQQEKQQVQAEDQER